MTATAWAVLYRRHRYRGYVMRTVHRWACTIVVLVSWLFPSAIAEADSCALRPIAEQMQRPAQRAAEPQRAEYVYRKQLLRFTNGFYGALSQDILRGDGEYLLALQQLMGSEGDQCLRTYRQLLLQETNSQDFALALWSWRVAEGANTVPVQDLGSVTVN